jgi:hypothetical protein
MKPIKTKYFQRTQTNQNKGKFNLNPKLWNMKTKDKNMKCAKCKFKWNFIIKIYKKITPIWCKIIPKIDVEQIKDNMKKNMFIYTLLGTYFNFFLQTNSGCFKMSQINSRYLKIFQIILR